MLLTKTIESKNYFRKNVVSAELISFEDNKLLLKTVAIIKGFEGASSDDDEMFFRMKNSADGDEVSGRLLIEFLEKDSLRIRYFEGDEIKENDTPMVAKPLCPAEKCQLIQEENQVTVSFGNAEAVITLNPYSLTVINLLSCKKVEISGKEKNFFNHRDSLNTGICHIPKSDLPISTENFALAPHEAIYGFGEKFIKLNKIGQTIEFDTQDGIGIGTPRTYKNIPFFVSTNGYGAYFNHSAYMTFWVGSLYAGDIQFAVMDDFLDYYIFLGDIKTILNTYTSLTGKSEMPPKWSFGYWQSKISYNSDAESLDVIDNMRTNALPVDVMHIDTNWFKENWYCTWEFDGERFNPEKYIAELKKRNIRLSLWQLPYVRAGSKAFEEFKAVDGFVKTKDGEMYDLRSLGVIMKNSPQPVGIIDFTNPKAVEVYKELLRRLFRLGVSIIKTDFGEAAPADGIYFDGTEGHKMHNLYPLLYNKAAFEVSKEMNGDDAIIWGRSAYAGNQRYPLYWGGDNSPNFNNIIPQLAGGLSLGLSGFPFWSQDVGGFLGETNPELLIRWMQFSILMSHIRIHGYGTRELYSFGDECINICRRYLKLRYSLLPYLWSVAKTATDNALPLLRPLVLEYQNDPNVWNIEDQYISGEYLMVAPIYTPDNKRTLYLPEGNWTNWHTDEKIEGGRWINIEAPLDILPLYVKEGAIIPLCEPTSFIGEKDIEEIELRIYPFTQDGETVFNVNTDREILPIKYKTENGYHKITVGKTNISVNVVIKGDIHKSKINIIKE